MKTKILGGYGAIAIALLLVSSYGVCQIAKYNVKQDVLFVHNIIIDMSLGLEGVPTQGNLEYAKSVCSSLDNEKNGITEDCIIINEFQQ